MQGVIHLFDGVHSIQSTFEHPFWHRTLLTMAGLPLDAIAERTEIAGRLLRDLFQRDSTPVNPGSARVNDLARHVG